MYLAQRRRVEGEALVSWVARLSCFPRQVAKNAKFFGEFQRPHSAALRLGEKSQQKHEVRNFAGPHQGASALLLLRIRRLVTL